MVPRPRQTPTYIHRQTDLHCLSDLFVYVQNCHISISGLKSNIYCSTIPIFYKGADILAIWNNISINQEIFQVS